MDTVEADARPECDEDYMEYGSCYFCKKPLTRYEASFGDVCEACAD